MCFLRKGSFITGVLTGFIISIVAAALIVGLLIGFNAAHFGQMAEVIYRIEAYSFQPVSVSDMVEGAAGGIVEALEDPYSTYLKPEAYDDLEEHLSGSYGGIGLLITEDESQQLIVVSPFKGTPAYKAGIKSGDVIVKIEDKDTSGISLVEAANLMKGQPGTKVRLTVLPRENGRLQDFEIERQEIQIPSVEGEILEEGGRIAYVNLMMFSEQTGSDLREVLRELDVHSADGVIVDLRDNPGGALGAAVDVAGYFIPPGPVVHIVYKSREETLTTQDNFIKKPLVVLVNEGSASASEIVAGAVKDSGSGTLVGSTTFGKGLVQSVFPLTDGAALKLTTAKYLTPKRKDIHKKGIKPDVEIKMDPELAREALLFAPNLEKDPQLQKAVEILQEQI